MTQQEISAQPEEKSLRVIICDDHQLFREGIAGLLAVRNINVVAQANNGKEALELVRAHKPDLVLMDISMPVMNGLEATRLIKNEMPDCKIIILTASEEESNLFEAIKSGAQGYLLKNLKSQEFFKLISTAARGEPAVTPSLAQRILEEFARDSTGGVSGDKLEDGEPALQNPVFTERELDLLRLLTKGYSNRLIAEQLVISENTVKYHLKNILTKLHMQNRSQVVAYTLQNGVLDRQNEH